MINSEQIQARAEQIIDDMKIKHGVNDFYAPVMLWGEFLSLLAERDTDKALIAELKVTEAHSQRGWNEAHDQESRAEARELQISEINDALCKLLPGVQYMDPPDGGCVTPLEQVARMVADYRQRIAELEKYAKNRDEENQGLMLTVGRLRIEREQASTLTVTLPQPEQWSICEVLLDKKKVIAAIRTACAAAGITLVVVIS